METKRFPLRVVLTAVTGNLLTKERGPRDNGIGDLYELLEWLTGEAPFTHQLGRFAEECRPWLLRWFPELANVPELGADIRGDGVERWLAGLEAKGFKDAYDVPQIPQSDHRLIDPVEELAAMAGKEKVIVVKVDN